MRYKIDIALVSVIAFGCACLAAACPTPPPGPPDSGATGGTEAVGGWTGAGGIVVVDAGSGGSPGIGGSPHPACTTTCCRSCQVLRDHHCREGEDTAAHATCEDRNCSHPIPAVMQLADLSSCTTLACIRSPGAKKRGVACEGGK